MRQKVHNLEEQELQNKEAHATYAQDSMIYRGVGLTPSKRAYKRVRMAFWRGRCKK